MAPGGPFDCVTNFSGTCTPDHAFETPGDIHLLAMPIFHLELGPAYLLLLAITSAIYLLMVFGIRLFLRLKVNGPFGKDDWACALSTSFGLVYSVVVVVQVFLGFGATLRHFSPPRRLFFENVGVLHAGANDEDERAFGGCVRTHGGHDDVDAAGADFYGLPVQIPASVGYFAAQCLLRSSMLSGLEISERKDIDIAQWGHRLATAVTSWILEFSLLAGAIHLV
jgi:hypothetical protein